MQSEFTFTIHDALSRPLFRGVRIIAGANGVNRRIRWVHILEVSDAGELIHGEEMILSTGMAFRAGHVSPAEYLQNLINLNVSCLCLEIVDMDAHAPVPAEMIALAEQYDFPLLVFLHTVRFIDITHDLHSLIINQQYSMLQNLERISREFHHHTLTSQGTENVLKVLYNSTQATIAYLPSDEAPLFIPDLPSGEKKEWTQLLQQKLSDTSLGEEASAYQWRCGEAVILLRPIGAMGQTWAYLALLILQEPTEYHHLVLESASLSLAQDLLRKRYMEERRLHTENVWVNELLHEQTPTEDQLQALTGVHYAKMNTLQQRVCVLEIEEEQTGSDTRGDTSFESTGFHLSLLLRSTLERQGFRAFVTLKNNRLVVLTVDVSSHPKAVRHTKDTNVTERLQQAFVYVDETLLNKKQGGFRLHIGIGQAYTGFKHAHISYEEAVKSLLLCDQLNKATLFYENLGVYQLLIDLRSENRLTHFVNTQLGSLLQEEEEKRNLLLYTLKIYLENNGSKKAAAQQLHIVRQSLYYRLEKIKMLLGDNIESADKRIALQLALYAYELLYPNTFHA
ncbi:PucR family transcriptional regulator [Aneurinibacillus sp. REN35]|uniref:PucR family transcriptional regulator n=1 Tax=Aneurinibacillus sp. REN35 TaxID=3237286 RepID=UPI0035282FC4